MFGNKKLYELSELLKENGGPIPMSRAGIYLAVKKGEIPSVHIGNRIFVPWWFLDKLLEKPGEQN